MLADAGKKERERLLRCRGESLIENIKRDDALLTVNQCDTICDSENAVRWRKHTCGLVVLGKWGSSLMRPDAHDGSSQSYIGQLNSLGRPERLALCFHGIHEADK
jgi:hypothetical protein